jgi:hypothetical protein
MVTLLIILIPTQSNLNVFVQLEEDGVIQTKAWVSTLRNFFIFVTDAHDK